MWASARGGAPRSRGLRRYAPLVVFFLLVVVAAALFHEVLLPFVLAAFFVYLVAPVVDRLQRLEWRGLRLPRWASVLVLYALVAGFIAVVALTIIPELIDEVVKLSQTLPALIKDANDRWLPEASAWVNRLLMRVFGASSQPAFDLELEIRESVQETLGALATHAGDALALGRKVVQGVVGGLTKTVLTAMVTAFLLVDTRSILRFVRSLVPKDHRPTYDELLGTIDSGLAGVVRGQLLICLINGVLSYIGFVLLGVPFALVLGLVAGVFSLIPIFGTILSSVPAVLLGLTAGFWTGVLVLAWILGIHALEANLLNPKIMGNAAKIHPVVVVFALLAGEHTFGLVGALLAVPLVSIVQSLFLHFSRVMVRGDEDTGRQIGPGSLTRSGDEPVEGAAVVGSEGS
ncbi:AI-2E family transporter [Myxococcota bacterium]|nr:AI-2E family transporter [Myxococcota bacterium]